MLVSKQLTIGSTAVELTEGLDTDQQYALRLSVLTATANFLIGGSDLGSSNGYFGFAPFEIPKLTGPIYGITPGGSATVSVLISSV